MKNPPLFRAVFDEAWPALPSVFHKHYAPRPGTDDTVRVEGRLNVHVSPLVSLMSRLTGALIPWSGQNIPVTVTFHCGADGKSFHFDRAFHYPGRGTRHFTSTMVHLGGNELIEFIKFGIGWRLTYDWEDEKVILRHRGYIWRLFGIDIPLPIGLVMGHGYAEEKALSDTRFHMWTHAHHPLFGRMLYYEGEFEIAEVKCATTS